LSPSSGRDLSILVPVLNRPHRVQPLLDSALAATPEAEVLFIADPDDQPEIDALEEAGANYLTYDHGYAGKINYGVRKTDRPLIFSAADDLHFHPGWLDIARAEITDQIHVVGTNDLCSDRVRAGTHATHLLMTRDYALLPTADGGRGPFCENYHHWFCDDELVETAISRNAIAFAIGSIVEHYHPMVGKADVDPTYIKGQSRQKQDKRLFHRRRKLWKSQS
jgi:glycosyltransferase involved in cell wall biosynthesis